MFDGYHLPVDPQIFWISEAISCHFWGVCLQHSKFRSSFSPIGEAFRVAPVGSLVPCSDWQKWSQHWGHETCSSNGEGGRSQISQLPGDMYNEILKFGASRCQQFSKFSKPPGVDPQLPGFPRCFFCFTREKSSDTATRHSESIFRNGTKLQSLLHHTRVISPVDARPWLWMPLSSALSYCQLSGHLFPLFDGTVACCILLLQVQTPNFHLHPQARRTAWRSMGGWETQGDQARLNIFGKRMKEVPSGNSWHSYWKWP